MAHREYNTVAQQLIELRYVHAGTIPNYARSIDGTLHSTMFYYKILG